MKCSGGCTEGWEEEEGEGRMVSAPGSSLRAFWPRLVLGAIQGKHRPGCSHAAPALGERIPPPSQPPLPPCSWRALHSPGPCRSSHVGDIIAGCHGKTRLSKTRPLGLIPCVSGNEGFIAHLCNGAETAGAGPAARGQAHNPPSARATPRWPLPWGTGEQFFGVTRGLLSYFWGC